MPIAGVGGAFIEHAVRVLAALACAAGLALAPAPFADARAQSRFDIEQFVVEGNSLLPEAEVRRLVAPFEGRSRDFGDVQRALEALQEAYVGRGFNAVRVLVPEQDLVAGRVRLQVIEARIGAVRVEGNQHFDTSNVRASLPTVREGESPNAGAISANVQLINENPAKQVGIALEPAAGDANKVDVLVRVTDDKPSRWTLSLDNSGSSPTGYHRVGLGYQNANLWNRDHVLNVQYVTSPDHLSDVAIFGAGYRVPFYGRKGFFDVFGGYSDVNSGTVQNLFTVSGSGTIFGMRYTQMLPRIEAYEQKLALGWDYRAFRNNVALIGVPGTLLPNLTIQPISLTYNGRVSKVGQDLFGYVTYLQNLPGSANGDQNAFTAQRAGADADYSILRYGGAYTRTLPDDYLLRASFNAQYTRDLLVPGEQFGMGGSDSVRGYFEREVSSDIGHRASVEAYTPDFGGRLGAGWRARALAFVDAARGHDRVPARLPANEINGLSSIGLGFRLTQGKTLSARLDYAHVLNAAGSRPAGKDRLHFSLAYSF